MKEVIGFLRWQISKYKFSDWVWFVGCGLIGSGLAASEAETSKTMLIAGGALLLTLMLKWMIWDTTRSQWDRYKREKANLFKTIKEGK
jgi:ABC-type nickel/cobalt efflux system permease component RcnA